MSILDGFREGYVGANHLATRLSNEYQLNPTQDGWMAYTAANDAEAYAYDRWRDSLFNPPVDDRELSYELLGRFWAQRYNI